MANQPSKDNSPQTDEIDLGQLLKLIGQGFQRGFRGFLMVFLYLKKHLLILVILGIVGLAIGYGLTKIISKKQKIEVIVKPNMESKNYLYEVIGEVQANLEAKDSLFFRDLGIEITKFNGYEVTIEPIETKDDKGDGQMEYLELLQKFENTGIISDIVRTEVLNKTSLNHRITFLFKDREKGPKLANTIVAYINSNSFYDEILEISMENARQRIEANNVLIQQLDQIITNYSDKMAEQTQPTADGKIVLDNEEKVNITGLFALKNDIIRDTERKRMELMEQRAPISIINFGKPQLVQKSFFTKKIVLVPSILIILFLLVDLIKYLNRKSKEVLG